MVHVGWYFLFSFLQISHFYSFFFSFRAFSSIGALEGQWVRKYGFNDSSNSEIDLSEQNLVDCVKNSFGCNGGQIFIIF